MVRGQRDQARLLIDLAGHVDGADAAVVAGVEQADFDALFRQGHPGINVGGVVVEIDENVVALAPGQTGGDKAQGERSGADQRDFLRFRLEEAGGQFAGVAEAGGRDGLLLVVERGARGVVAHGVGDAAGQGADGGVGEKGLFAGDGEFVAAQVFVGKDFGERHFMSMTLLSC